MEEFPPSFKIISMKPIIRLHISNPLNKRFSLNTDGLSEKFPALSRVWKKEEKKILNGLKKITSLHFLQNYIDVFLIDPNTSRSISHPIILGTGGSNDKFIRIFSHELIHKLTWDNTSSVDWHTKIEKMFREESKLTAYHIMVHAILEALYTNILKKPEQIIEDIKMCEKMPEYKRAWEIVKEEGYQNIINKLKSK